MKISNNLNLDSLSSNQYEIIENETLRDRNFNELTISGSLLSQNSFYGTTFKDCVFFGTKIEKSRFKGCHFINCSFQFSAIKECNFSGSVFKDCHWDTTLIQNSSFISSFLDHKTQYFASKEKNFFEECFAEEIFDEHLKAA